MSDDVEVEEPEFDAEAWFEANLRGELLRRLGSLRMDRYYAVLDEIEDWAREEAAS